MNIPKISIVMPVFNRERYIKSSVESILNQTFSDFEFIIVNDGSTDKTLEILESYKDDRIKIFNNETNRGIVYSRNRGLKETNSELIGMFDSDDIATPDKFQLQYSFLEKNPDIAMVGAGAKWIDEDGKLLTKKWKVDKPNKQIPAILLFRNYFIQSTILVRKKAIPKGLYSSGFDVVEDYKMWFEISQYHKVANINKYLILYRVHSDNVSSIDTIQYSLHDKLYRFIFDKYGINITDEELNAHYAIKNNEPISSKNELINIEKWLLKIAKHNKTVKKYNQNALKKVIFNRWLKVCSKSKKIGFFALKRMIFSPLSKYWI